MEHFKAFLIRLQTFEIKAVSGKQDSMQADLSHECPYQTTSFKNHVSRLQKLAMVDLMNLSPAQIGLQLQLLDALKEKFRLFWRKYADAPVPVHNYDPAVLFSYLSLDDIFIVARPEVPYYNTTESFLDDLYDSIRFREACLEDFLNDAKKIIATPAKATSTGNDVTKWEEIPIFKKSIINELFILLKEYFLPEEQGALERLLTTSVTSAGPFTFNGNGNQLADAFKQLFEANLIVGCNKAALEQWILKYFLYLDKGKPKAFTEKYLNDIISSDTKNCQSPILDVKKQDGQFIILPLERNKRNNKKY